MKLTAIGNMIVNGYNSSGIFICATEEELRGLGIMPYTNVDVVEVEKLRDKDAEIERLKKELTEEKFRCDSNDRKEINRLHAERYTGGVINGF